LHLCYKLLFWLIEYVTIGIPNYGYRRFIPYLLLCGLSSERERERESIGNCMEMRGVLKCRER
jgi:hypothetical protein